QETNRDPAHRAYADYCDVWSDLMAENFFNAEADWCAANGLEMQIHIEHEEILPQMAIADGDYFKAMRHMGMPGIDTIWNQMWPGTVNDFPKLASSAAHLNGHPHAMIEAFAAYNPAPDIKQARWVVNEAMALGINHYEWMFWPASTRGPGAGPRGFYSDPGFPALAAFTNRLSYLLGEGKPAAQIGVYIPSSSFWFGDTQANDDFKNVVHQLLQNQRDLDYVDEGALSGDMKQQGGTFINHSGQAYRAIIVPPVDAMSKAALDNLHAFAQAGGKVVFLGHAPALVMDKNFLSAKGPADISWATLETSVEITPKVLAALPAPDVALDHTSPDVRYNHRQLKDAEVYFFFNESDQPLDMKATVATSLGQSAQTWDGDTGKISPLTGAMFSNGTATIPLKLAPWSATLIVLGGGAVMAGNP
ncbi:MAG: glycosyl hydrolase, partial [Bryobacteraceae bacterium]